MKYILSSFTLILAVTCISNLNTCTHVKSVLRLTSFWWTIFTSLTQKRGKFSSDCLYFGCSYLTGNILTQKQGKFSFDCSSYSISIGLSEYMMMASSYNIHLKSSLYHHLLPYVVGLGLSEYMMMASSCNIHLNSINYHHVSSIIAIYCRTWTAVDTKGDLPSPRSFHKMVALKNKVRNMDHMTMWWTS